MPNWCWNNLVITPSENDEAGEGFKQLRAKLLFMVDDMEASPNIWGGAFDYLVGRAGDYDEVDGWYEHNIREYGSKWQKSAKDFMESLEDDGECITMGFDTAWSPVTEFSKKLSKQYRLNIEHTFDEQGDWFAGKLLVDDGEVEEEFCESYYKGTYLIDTDDFWERISSDMENWFDDLDDAQDYYDDHMKELSTFLSPAELIRFKKEFDDELENTRITNEMLESSGLVNWKDYLVNGEKMKFTGCHNRVYNFMNEGRDYLTFKTLPEIKELELI
jgi:hypothetical protein